MKRAINITEWNDSFWKKLNDELETLQKNGDEIIDIKYSTQYIPSGDKENSDSSFENPEQMLVYSALIIYKENY